MPASVRFWSLLLAGTLSLCATYVALLLGTADYADVLALSRIQYHDEGYYFLPARVTAAGWARAQQLSAAVAVVLLLTMGLLLTRRSIRQRGWQLGREASQVFGRLLESLCRLSAAPPV